MEKTGLILIPFLTGYGGTETVIKNLLNEYNKEKNQYNINLKLYSLGGFINGNWLQFPNVKVFQFPKERYIREFLYLFLLPYLILYAIIKEKPDFIISTNPIMWTIAKLCSKIFHKNIKIIAWYHYSYKLKPVSKYCLFNADYFFTICKSGKYELEKLNISKDRIFVIYNPVIPSKHLIKHSSKFNQLIYVGRLEYDGQKNISELFKALSILKNKSWTLRIYGTGPDYLKLKLLSEKLHISNHIYWMGFVRDVFENIVCADALVLTSTYEGFPMVLLEAISQGLYVISSNCPSGPSELINADNGNIYKLGRIYQLANLINDVLMGKKCLDQKRIKGSIHRCYVDNYFMYFMNSLNIVINK